MSNFYGYTPVAPDYGYVARAGQDFGNAVKGGIEAYGQHKEQQEIQKMLGERHNQFVSAAETMMLEIYGSDKDGQAKARADARRFFVSPCKGATPKEMEDLWTSSGVKFNEYHTRLKHQAGAQRLSDKMSAGITASPGRQVSVAAQPRPPQPDKPWSQGLDMMTPLGGAAPQAVPPSEVAPQQRPSAPPAFSPSSDKGRLSLENVQGAVQGLPDAEPSDAMAGLAAPLTGKPSEEYLKRAENERMSQFGRGLSLNNPSISGTQPEAGGGGMLDTTAHSYDAEPVEARAAKAYSDADKIDLVLEALGRGEINFEYGKMLLGRFGANEESNRKIAAALRKYEHEKEIQQNQFDHQGDQGDKNRATRLKQTEMTVNGAISRAGIAAATTQKRIAARDNKKSSSDKPPDDKYYIAQYNNCGRDIERLTKGLADLEKQQYNIQEDNFALNEKAREKIMGTLDARIGELNKLLGDAQVQLTTYEDILYNSDGEVAKKWVALRNKIKQEDSNKANNRK